jgi:hypothetical protein
MSLNIYQLTQYVNLDVDDSYSEDEIARWFNKGIASYNLIPPLTEYPFIEIDEETIDDIAEPYDALNKNFMLGIMLPFISSAIRAQESAVMEKQEYYQEFLVNATRYKMASNIDEDLLLNPVEGIDRYQIGENVYMSDFDYSPMQSNWQRPAKKIKPDEFD